MPASRSVPRVLLATLFILALSGAALAVGGDGLYVNSPGSSSSLGAGMDNPAVWALQSSGGSLIGIHQPRDYEEFGDLDWSFIASGRNIAFAYQNFNAGDDDRYQDYTLGFAGGDMNQSFGVSYQWKGLEGVEDRWNIGLAHRGRSWALGLGSDFDKRGTNANYYGDLGIRPFGPRLTLFGDAHYLPFMETDGEEYSFTYGFGAEIMAMPGMSIAGRFDLGGASADGSYDSEASSFSLGVRVALDGGSDGVSRTGVITNAYKGTNGAGEDDYFLSGNTYVFESGRKASVLPFSVEGQKYPELHMKGNLPYRRFAWFDDGRTFLGLMRQIEYYADNPQTEGLVINMSGFYADPEMMLELRDQLAGFRARGKKVVIYVDRVSQFSYMLASVADELWMDPQGGMYIPGLAFGATYMAGTLDKLGVGLQEFRYFKFKSAIETFARTEFSEGQREQLQKMMDDWYDISVGYILASRGMDQATWDKAVEDYGEVLPQDALDMGFVDKLGDWHDMKENLDEIEVRDTPDVSATMLAGLVGDRTWRDEVWGERDRIALLYAIGGCSMDSGIKGRLLSKEIRKVREDGRVKAVVLRADSPGGDPLPSDLVSRELKKTMEKKPVIISQGFVAASGGYWISMHSDKILASPLTITGSIGVISGHFYDEGLSEKLGMTYDQVKIGSHADLDSGYNLPFFGTVPHRPYDQKELDRVEYAIKALYQDFLEQVAEGRDMSVDEVAEVAQGRIWSGRTGMEIGLVDELGGLWTALSMAKEAAGIDPDDAVCIVEGPAKGKFDLSFLAPSIIGVDVDELAEMRDPLAGLNPRYRAYIEALQDAEGPQLLLEPFDVIDGATVY